MNTEIRCKSMRYTQYTPFTTYRSYIMDRALAINILTMPKRANTPPKANYSKCCIYRRNCGHSMEECSALKDKIEELVKLNHLKEFVHKPRSYRLEGRSRLESSQGRDREHVGQSEKGRSRSRSREREEKPLDQQGRL